MSPAKLSLVSLLLSLTSAHPFTTPLRRQETSGPVITSNFQDPSVLQVSDTWYAFSGPNRNPSSGSPGSNVQVATSPDFSSWAVQGGIDALPNPGAWAANPPHVWAPDVAQLPNGQFVMYYAASLASDPRFHCVGAATAFFPTGPYSPASEPVFCDTSIGGAIDPTITMDPSSGSMYVAYKVDGNSIGHGGACSNTVAPIVSTPIVLQEISANDGVTLIGGGVQILTNGPDDGPLVEAPSLFYDSNNAQWVLFFNSQCYTSTSYRIDYATSRSITGPYSRQGTFLATGSTSANVQVPGGIDITPDGTHAVFHGDLNLVWLNGDADGSPRTRGMYAATLGTGGGTVALGAFA